ncbi:MAG: hypothetical protein E5W25_33045, partial [Mesorhizobium sp.]
PPTAHGSATIAPGSSASLPSFTLGNPGVGDAIAEGLRQGRVCLRDRDAAVLLARADRRHLF